eukprot:gene7619-11942_t
MSFLLSTLTRGFEMFFSYNNEIKEPHQINKKKQEIKNKELYIAEEGIIWLNGQNNPIGDPDENPEAYIPFLHEQANVLNTILMNKDKFVPKKSYAH